MLGHIGSLSIAKIKDNVGNSTVSTALLRNGIEREFIETYLESAARFAPAKLESYIDEFTRPRVAPVLRDFDPGIRQRVTRNLDIDGFGAGVHAALSNLSISGYTLRVRQNDRVVYTLIWNWARRPQDDNPRGWQPNVKMHVASVSKLVTSMAIVKRMTEMGLSFDTPIIGYLPTYLTKGAQIDKITFRHLLTHRSGFRREKSGGPNDGYSYTDLKALLTSGVSAANFGTWHYHNGNYIALRVLLTVLTGRLDIHQKLTIGTWLDLSDMFWDSVSISNYTQYVTQNVLMPSFCQASLEPPADGSLAYASNLSLKGLLANASPAAGTAGWWFSCDEICNIMNTYWRSDAIVRKTIANRALRDGFGLDDPNGWQFHNGRPDCFMKGGYWSDDAGKTQQCVVAFAPRGVEIAVFVNSPIMDNNVSGIVAGQLAANLH